MPLKVYIIGRVPDVLSVSSQKKFSNAQRKLENLNIQVFNPIQSFIDSPHSKEEAIKKNIISLLNASAVFVLNDLNSGSANNFELLLALKLNKLIIHEF